MKVKRLKIKKVTSIILALMIILALFPFQVLSIKAASSELIINDSDIGEGVNKFNFQGNWKTSVGYPDRFNGGDEHWFNFENYTEGDDLPSYSVKFKGTGIELYGEKQPNLGIYNIYLDGKKIDTVDAYSSSIMSNQKLYSKTGLDYEEHILKVELSGTKSVNSSAADGEVDYVKIFGISEETEGDIGTYISKIEDSDTTTKSELFKFKYTGNWKSGSGSPEIFSNGDEHYAYSGDYYEIKFIGSKIEIYATKNEAHGVYDVFIDGEKVGIADGTTVGSNKHQQLIYASENLVEGEHILKVALPEESNKAIQVDFAKVYHKTPINAKNIALSEYDLLLESGMTRKVNANVSPSIATNKEVVWQSEDEDIVTVDSTGMISAVSKVEATTKVIASIKGTNIKAEVNVKVVPAIEYLSAFIGSTDILDTQDDYYKLMSQYKETWSDVAWRGDVLNSKIVTCSRDEKVHNVQVIASDFKSDNSLIKASNIEVKWLKEVMANIGRGNSSAPVKPFPDVIYKGGKIDIEPETVQSAWININIPKDAKPGIYKGKIKVTADELDKAYEFDYQFEVLDLVQPETSETDTQIQIWQHPFAVANYYGVEEEEYFTEEHFKYMRSSMKEYKDLGGKDVVANIVEEAWGHQSYYSDPSMVKWTKKKDGTFEFDYTWYDAWINFQIECGVLDPENNIGQIKCYSIVPWNNTIAYYDEALGRNVSYTFNPGNQNWIDMWKPFLRDFMKHSKEKGWFDMTYISMDERGLEQLRPAVDLIESVKDENGESFKISSAFNYDSQTDYSFTDRIDDISIGVSHVSHQSDKMREMSEHRRNLGLTTTIYACTGDYPGNFTISDPADNTWMMWYTLAHNTDGFMRWAWDNWVQDPLNNVTYKYWEPGDGWFIYPVEKGDDSNPDYYYSTPRYEMLKKGVRDINKAKYLMEKSEELNTEITELVESMRRPKQGGNGYGSAVAASEEERKIVFTETERMREGVMTLSKEYIAQQNVLVETIITDKDEVVLSEGESIKVDCKVVPENATDKSLNWSSDDETVATVKDGYITAVKEGNTFVNVKSNDGNASKEIKVTVKKSTSTKPIKPENPNNDEDGDDKDASATEKTGDSSNFIAWGILLLMGAGVIFMFIRKKRA